MAQQPSVPRRSPMIAKTLLITRDWDLWFQGLAQQLATLTPAGTFVDNAAAVAAGLDVGQVYQTATGEIRVVV